MWITWDGFLVDSLAGGLYSGEALIPWFLTDVGEWEVAILGVVSLDFGLGMPAHRTCWVA